MTAEGVKVVFDFGRIMDQVPKPACGETAETLYQALTMFERYYETNESFDHLTHGMGPGLVGMVVHGFMDFLGNLVNQKLDHSVTGNERGTPLCVYVQKMREIVSSVVTDETEEVTGRLSKVEEKVKEKEKEKEKEPVTSSSKGKKKKSEKKQAEPTSENEEDDEVISVDCSDDENQFTTLTSSDGKEYHPPSKKQKLSRYAHRDAGADVDKKFEDIKQLIDRQQKKLDVQQDTISRLQRENETARSKLMKIPTPAEKKKKKSSGTKQTSLQGFIPTQMLKLLSDSSSSEDGDIFEVPSEESKPDSTQKALIVDVTPSDAGSEVNMPLTQRSRSRRRIESGNTSTAGSTCAPESSVCDVATSQVDIDVDTEDLRRKKEELEEKCAEMEMLLLGQETENKFRHYQQDITHHIQKLRSAMIGAFGTDVSTNQNVIDAKGALERACVRSSHMGYTIRVDEHFVDRVEKSLQAGQVPEKQMEASKTDNSVNDPVLGQTVDVLYELKMPFIVKSEKAREEEDGDLLFVGETPAPVGVKQPVWNITVKPEPEDNFSTQTQNTQQSSPVFTGGNAKKNQENHADSDNEDERRSPASETTGEQIQPLPAETTSVEIHPSPSGNAAEEMQPDKEDAVVDVETCSQESSQVKKRSADGDAPPEPKKKRRKNTAPAEAEAPPGRLLRPRKQHN